MRKTLATLVLAGSMVVGLGLPRMSLGAERAGASMASSPATGSLVGSAILPPSRINLTTEGTTDWAHWGLTAPSSFDQKANVVSQIPTFSNLAGGTLGQTTLPAIFSWSDGTPDTASTGTSTAVSLKGNGQGFGLTLPADLTSRTVHLYVAVSSGQANLTASLSDNSAAPYSDSSMTSFFGNRIQEYTLTYQAASSGQSLHVAFTLLNNYGAGTLSLAAASMSGGGPPAATPTASPPAASATASPTVTPTATSTPTSASVPNVMVDTDMITSVDDVGALAIVNSLANQGKAKLVGVVVNSEVTGHPHISTVGCVDAIDTYYGNSVPIGATGPFTTSVVTPDFTTPCATNFPKTYNYTAMAPPPSALQVYRQTLAAQPDGSVVIVEIGFEGNLSALLSSTSDGFSSLDGSHLIAKKVKMLVVMGGGYPVYPPVSGPLGEHNFRGNPNAAINVADNWPTKVVYSGYELGGDIGTGQNLCTTAPLSTSPVRAAYTVYVGCNNYYFSWDLTAAYHAIMGAADPVMTETHPGSNMIASDGTNAWIDNPTSGKDYYLVAASHPAVATALNAVLAYNPGSTSTATSTPTATGTPVPGTATSTATATGTPVPGTATGTPTTTTTTGGSLVGSAVLPPSRINLTTEGTSDWAHWGLTAPTSFDQKANVVSQIPTFSNLAGGTLGQTTLPAIFSWSDGTPDLSSIGTSTAVSLKGNGQGFGLTLPADLTSRTVHLYVAVSSGQANLTASLSDNSAAPYSDSSMTSFFGNRIQEYTLTYQAASSGQSLNLRFTLLNNYGAGTISLAAASMSGGGPPAATSTATATATVGGSGATSTATSTATATGTPVPGTATGTPTTTTGTGGSLVGSAILPPSRINLTTEGTADWAHWGLTSPSSFDHKANVGSQIPTFSNLAGGALGQSTLPAILSWSDGTPDAASTGTSTAVSLRGNGQGFGLSLPADLTSRTVHLYVAVSSGQANLTASLSDNSAAPYSDSSMTSFFGNRMQEYTFTYRAGMPGQSLHLAFTLLNNYGAGTLSLAAATLE